MFKIVHNFSGQLLSRVRLCNPTDCNTPGFPVLHQLPELAQAHVHWVCDAIQSSHPLFSLLLPSIFPSIRIFSNESVLRIRWPMYWSFSISPSSEYSGLISFRIDWLDLLTVQGTLSRDFSNTTVQKHQFFGTQLSLYSWAKLGLLEMCEVQLVMLCWEYFVWFVPYLQWPVKRLCFQPSSIYKMTQNTLMTLLHCQHRATDSHSDF